MYAKTSVTGGTTGGVLAVTGFSVAAFVLVATLLILGGLLLVRSSRRRAANHS
jgi:hypothetical protein